MKTVKRILSLLLIMMLLTGLTAVAYAESGGAVNPGSGAFGDFEDDNSGNDMPYFPSVSQETVTLRFETNGGTELRSITVTKGAVVDLNGYLTEKDEYSFAGWYLDEALTQAVADPAAFTVSGSMTIYAAWTPVDTDCPRDETCPMYPYGDLDLYAWYHDGVHYCLERGLMLGTGDAKFEPYGTATRATIVTVLWRLAGSPEMEYSPVFSDVADGQWYTDAVLWAAENGVTLGYDTGDFGHADPITREQMISFLHRFAAYLGLTEEEAAAMLPPYTYSDWAENDVIWAHLHELLSGFGIPMDDLTEVASRAEIAVLLFRFCGQFGV